MPSVHRCALIVSCLGLIACPSATTPSKKTTPKPTPAKKVAAADEHPETEPGKTCDDCHKEDTPEAYKAWQGSLHGLNGVKCFVCHGSTGKDFVKRPSSQRCRGCHAAEVAQLATPKLQGKRCDSCHPGHELKPKDRTLKSPHGLTTGSKQ